MDAWKELFKAISENVDRGYQAAEKRQASEVNSALDMAVLHYKQEKEKQEKKARLYGLSF
jgi:hypothetical protein